MAIAALCGVYALIYFRSRDGDWHPAGRQMTRFKNGMWEYRDITDAESDCEWQDRQW